MLLAGRQSGISINGPLHPQPQNPKDCSPLPGREPLPCPVLLEVPERINSDGKGKHSCSVKTVTRCVTSVRLPFYDRVEDRGRGASVSELARNTLGNNSGKNP